MAAELGWALSKPASVSQHNISCTLKITCPCPQGDTGAEEQCVSPPCAAPRCRVLGYHPGAVLSITRVVPRHRDPAKGAAAQRRGCSADPEPWSPRKGTGGGLLQLFEPSSVPSEEQLPRAARQRWDLFIVGANCSCEMYLQKRLFVQSAADKQTPVLPGTLCNRWGLGTL